MTSKPTSKITKLSHADIVSRDAMIEVLVGLLETRLDTVDKDPRSYVLSVIQKARELVS